MTETATCVLVQCARHRRGAQIPEWTHTFPATLKRKSRMPNGDVIAAKALAVQLAKSAVDRAKSSKVGIQMATRSSVAAKDVLVSNPRAVRPVVARASSNR